MCCQDGNQAMSMGKTNLTTTNSTLEVMSTYLSVFIKFPTDLQTHLNPLLTLSKKHSTTPRVLSNSFSNLGYVNNISHTSDLQMVRKVELSENTDS